MVASLLWVMAACLLQGAQGSYSTCEVTTDDCPVCPPTATHSFALLVPLSGHGHVVAQTHRAQATVRAAGGVQRLEGLALLHLTVAYFCCHTQNETVAIEGAVRGLQWGSVAVGLDTFGCNVDARSNVTVYLHAMPTHQASLAPLAATLTRALARAGIAVRPRSSKYHMTVARVGPSYPADTVVAQLAGWDFGAVRLCHMLLYPGMVWARPAADC